MASEAIPVIGQEWAQRPVVTFHGQHDTHIDTGEEYPRLTLGEIFTMEPGCEPKSSGRAFIPSAYHEYDARSHKAQREHGSFVTLAADIDKGNHPLKTVQSIVTGVCRDAAWLIYASAHACPGDMRWRVVIPVAEPLTFDDWNDAQNALFNVLERFNLECDRALQRAAQPVYLPNVPPTHAKTGEPLRDDDGAPRFYERSTSGCAAPALDLARGPISTDIALIKQQREAEERERLKLRAEAEKRRAERPLSDGGNVIDEFNLVNPIANLLTLYGYTQCPRNGDDWRSPMQTGESYATRIMGDSWVSLSGSDAGAGLGAKHAAGCFGDAYDLFLHFEHGGDHKAAFRQLYAERRASQGPALSSPPPAPQEGDPGWTDLPDGPSEPEDVVIDVADVADALDIFEVMSPADLEAMPPPSWLVHETISDEGLSILYGDPGSYKSFIALDMALRISMGMDWHGVTAKQTGVLYIAGEGARGLGKRVTGWRMKHKLRSIDAPFMLLPMAVQVLDDVQRAKLIRTIRSIMANTPVGLIVIDTVSRSIAGIDENSQDTMTRFVDACDEIRRACGGSLLGIHHSGKDKDKGMRGSSVLLGAVDASLRLTKSEHIVTMQIEKQKDAEQGQPIYFEMERLAWMPDGAETREDEVSTLIPNRSGRPKDGTESISMDQIRRAFGLMADAWGEGRPLSNKAQTKADGRYAPAIFARQIGGDADAWSTLIMAWLEGGNLAIEMADKKRKLAGLVVLDAPI